MSFKGKMFHMMMRYRHLFRGKLRREVVNKNTSLERLRKECDETAERLLKLPEKIKICKEEKAPLNAEWIIPDDAAEEKVLLYYHGGGFVMGNVKSHRGIVANFVRTVGFQALLFDYSLAPEHPAPAAINDSCKIYRWLLEQGYLPENIIFVGDSSGGGIEIATLLKLKDSGIPLPAACVAFSPSLDMTISGDSHQSRRKADPCTPVGMTETYYAYYVGNGDPADPYVSPLFGDPSGLPPIMIQVGNDEVMRDDSIEFTKKALISGVDVHLHVWTGMFHCFPLLAPMFREATEAMREVSGFIRKHWNG